MPTFQKVKALAFQLLAVNLSKISGVQIHLLNGRMAFMPLELKMEKFRYIPICLAEGFRLLWGLS